MSTTVSTAAAALEPVTALVPHLRWRIGAFTDDEVASTRLVADPDALAAQVQVSGDGRGSDDPHVLASLWWQAYAYRVAGTTLSAWALTGAAPDPAAPHMAVGVARSRPASVVFADGATVIADLDRLVERLFVGHLEPVAASLRARHQLGEPLLWGNTAAGIASALGAVEAAEGAPPLRPAIEEITAALPATVGGAGTWSQADGSWHYRRHSCCLWWKTTVSNGTYCEDCSLVRGADSR